MNLRQSAVAGPRAMLAHRQAAAGALGYAAALLRQHAPVAGGFLVAKSLVTGLAAPLAVWGLAGLVDTLSGASGAVAPVPSILPWLAVLGAAFLLTSADGALSLYLAARTREAMDGAIRRRLLAQAIAVPLSAFEQPEYYTKLETGRRAIGGSTVQAFVELATWLSAAAGSVGLFVLFARTHWLLAAILLATTVLLSALGAWENSRFITVNYQTSPLKREAGYWAGLLAGREPAAELRLFGLGSFLVARWREVFDRYVADITAARGRLTRATFGHALLQEVVTWLTVLVLLVLAWNGRIGAGSLAALLYGLGRYGDATRQLSWTTSRLIAHGNHVRHLRDFLALEVEPPAGAGRRPPRPMREGVAFQDVSFTYPGADRPALAGVTLVLRPGERVALVGENGAGKTTLVKLLLGLYRPTSGAITVDGIDLTEIDPSEWRREATAIFQDFMRYPATAGENIAYADVTVLAAAEPDWRPAPARVARAAVLSGAATVIAGLPAGYATPLGKEFAGGAELSAGQWQRLALARAYLRDAQIVVLDEPTASLDPRAEVEVYRQFSQAAADRCAVFISHRLGSARLADRIVVLRAGRLVELGDHHTLLSTGGEYARMYRLQASWYAGDAPASKDGRGAPGGAPPSPLEVDG